MRSLRYRVLAPILAGALIGGAFYVTTPKVKAADSETQGQAMLPVEHAECAFFGPKREQYMQAILK